MISFQRARLLLVDDHKLVRQGLRQLLAGYSDLVVVGEASDGDEALARAHELRPDVILMDLRMPGCDGLRATMRLRHELPEAKVIILTVHGDDPDLVYQALQAGALGYVPKLCDVEELIHAVRLVVQGYAAVASPSLTDLVHFIGSAPEPPRPSVPPAAETEKLSRREREVLNLVAQGKSNREIARALCLSESTVRSHLHNILDKLQLTNRVQAAAFAIERAFSDKGTDVDGASPPPRSLRRASATRHG